MVKAALLGKIKDAACIDIGEQLFQCSTAKIFMANDWGNLALSDDSTNTVFGCLICHFVSFYPNMVRNPAQADMFAYISQLSVKLKYVEDCNIDNIEALDCLYRGKRIRIYHKRFLFQSTNKFESHSNCREFCGVHARFVWQTHALI